MEYKILIPILLVSIIFISGCSDTSNLSTNTNKATQQTETLKEVEEFCPDFSNSSDRLTCGENSCTFALLGEGYKLARDGEYKLYPWDAVPGQTYPYSFVSAPCRKGSDPGENVNYFYCEGMYTIITETDTEGNILSTRKPAVTLIVSDSKIIETVCD